MAEQASLNQLLQWSIRNSTAPDPNQTPSDPSDPNTQAPSDPSHGLTPQMLSSLLSGPSDADLMRESMTAILSPTTTPEDKTVAWDNFEQLIEQIDNANNIPSLGLWAPLLSQLEAEDKDGRASAAACCGTAVQNNVQAQEVFHRLGGPGRLVGVVLGDKEEKVRRKAVGAVSRATRNFQPGCDEVVEVLGKEGLWRGGVEAGDMEAVDRVVELLRERAASGPVVNGGT